MEWAVPAPSGGIREWAVPAPSGRNGQCQHPVEGMGSAVPAPSGGNGQCQHPVEGMAVPAGISVTFEKRTTSTVGKLNVLSPTKLSLVERLHCKG